jgi:hypothetical protein
VDEIDLSQLPPLERAERYRALAEEMRSRAVNSLSHDTRTAYLRMAVQWLDMADEAEAQGEKVSIEAQASPEVVALLRRFPS